MMVPFLHLAQESDFRKKKHRCIVEHVELIMIHLPVYK